MKRSIQTIVVGGYMEHVWRLEEGLYDSDENLIEERLSGLQGVPIPPSDRRVS